MTRKDKLKKRLLQLLGFAMTLTLLGGVSSCKETIDESNYAIAEGITAMDYVKEDTALSYMNEILNRVRLGESEQASPLSSVLAGRGNYTCFFPTNDAVQIYMDSLGYASIDSLLADSAQIKLIAYSCILDHGEEDAYESTLFPTEGSFSVSNLNDRVLTCTESSGVYTIAGTSTVIQPDLECTNGYIHLVDRVISPSSKMVPDLIMAADNMKIWARLLTETGWQNNGDNTLQGWNLQDYEDEDYKNESHDETRYFNSVGTFNLKQTRYLGYTAFVEPDYVLIDWLGLSFDAETLLAQDSIENDQWEEVKEALLNNNSGVISAYGSNNLNDLTASDNPINRFVAYHFVEGVKSYDHLVFHFNEWLYQYGSDQTNPQSTTYTVDVWGYFITVGEYPCLVKVLQRPETSVSVPYGIYAASDTTVDHPIYLNRIAEYDDDYSGSYDETNVIREGIYILSTNGTNDNNAQNGFYYPITAPLIYSTDLCDDMVTERIRFDVNDVCDEISSNNIRLNGYHAVDNGYFDNIFNETSSTEIYYLHQNGVSSSSWRDYQGDEFLFSGVYDFCLRLPPVPVTGTYELRMGASLNSSRGMAQIYFGSNKDNLPPAGLPFDMRQSASDNPSIPWVEDTEDEATDLENDKNLRNQGYMKGPKYMTICNGSGTSSFRTAGGAQSALRLIVTNATFDKNTTYYMRFKSVLEATDSQFFVDYFELVPSIIYNGTESEDVW